MGCLSVVNAALKKIIRIYEKSIEMFRNPTPTTGEIDHALPPSWRTKSHKRVINKFLLWVGGLQNILVFLGHPSNRLPEVVKTRTM